MTSVGPGDGNAERAAGAIRATGATSPEVAVIFGSGLGEAVSALEVEADLPYEDLPGVPTPTVPGHAGRVVLGRLAGVPTAAFLGRLHFYEGHPMTVVTLATRLSAALGARVLLSTGAVGGLDPSLSAGSLVVASDHLNLLGENPLRAWRDEDGRPPFVDLTTAYDPALADLALACAAELGIPATAGVYAAMPGPTYETPAEIEVLRRAGATVVGMSLVPEALAAAALGMRFAAMLCVTNVVGAGRVEHEDVTEVAGRFAARLGELLAAMLPKI